MVKEPSYSTMDIENLDYYYEDCVIGGPGSFVVSIKDREKFKEAIRTKLLLEVAGRTPDRRIVPVADKEPRVSCMIGEKIWQDRWGQSEVVSALATSFPRRRGRRFASRASAGEGGCASGNSRIDGGDVSAVSHLSVAARPCNST